MIKHKEQRVGVFIDVQNMYHSAKKLYNARVNFKEVLRTAVAGRKLVRAIAYVTQAKATYEDNFFEALSQQGFEVKMRELQVFASGAKKSDWDVGITIDAIKMSNKLDSIIIVTGDGDYLPLVSYLQENKGCIVEVIAFGESSSLKLKEACDDFTDLSQDKKKYLIRQK